MFARVTELTGTSPDPVERELRYFEDEILPEVEEIPGMCGGLILYDRDAGRALAIMLYADAESMENGRQQADTLRELVYQRLNLGAPPAVHEYEVAVARLTEAIGSRRL